MKKYSIVSMVVLLAPLVFSFAMGQDIFIPEIPQLIKIFHSSPGQVQLILSVFMLAVGAGQLMVGPLSDQLGRRHIILASVTCYALGSLLATFSTTVHFMIGMRIIQGIGACGMMVCSFAVVRDLFSGNDSAKVYSYLNGTVAISPLFAPLIGGYLDVWFGWRAPFYALGVLGLCVFISIYCKLNESLMPEARVPFDLSVFKRYLKILSSPQFLVFSFCSALALSCFFTFFSISPYILIEQLHVPETRYGIYFACVGMSFFVGSMSAGSLCEQLGVYNVVILGTIGILISGIWQFLWTLHAGTSIASFIIPTCLSGISGSFLMGAGAACALEPFGEVAGSASALLGAMQFLMATIMASIVLLWPVHSNLSYAWPLMISGLIMTAAVVAFRVSHRVSG